jgi:hypothetical protein
MQAHFGWTAQIDGIEQHWTFAKFLLSSSFLGLAQARLWSHRLSDNGNQSTTDDEFRIGDQ